MWYDDYDDSNTITLTFDDETEVECEISAIFSVNDREYIALIPEDSYEVFLYRYLGDMNIENIDNDDEHQIVADAYDELMDEDDWDDDDYDDD